MEAKFFKEFKYKYRHRKYKSVTIVLGDESCDLDSAVSAIGYAALMEYESRFQRNRFPGYRDPNPEIPRDIFIPMLDVRREDIHIKTEFLHLWAKYTFDVADLLLKDDLPSLKKQVQRDPTTKIVLVNHHILSEDYKYLAPYVTTIVDHRPMQPNAKSLYGRNVKWIMKDTASCASIVIDEIKYFDDRVDNYPLFFRWYPALLNILRATVVHDTLNFSPALNHFTDLDLKMAEYLEEYIETENPQDHPSTWSRATKLKGMLEARADVSKCIAFDVLKKDAKRVESIYFAHVPILLKDYMKKVDHLDAMPEVLEAYGCETLVMLCSYYPPVKIYEGLRKEFAVFSPDREFAEELIEYLHSWTSPSFILTPKLGSEVENLHVFDVHNMAATKEHFVVALNVFFESKREIALEMKRNQEKSTAVEENVKGEHNGTAKRNGTKKKQETDATPTTVVGSQIARKKPEVKIMEIEPVIRFGPIVDVKLDWEKQKLLGEDIVVELAEAMKKGLILGIPNLMEEQKIREKQGTVAETEMTKVVMAADELGESMPVEVIEHKIEEEQETVEKAIEELKTATEPQTVEESMAVKEQEPKIEKDQKITKVLKTVVEPQMVNVLKIVEKQIIGEEEKTVGGQKTVAEPQMTEESTTVEEQEQKIGEEQEMEEVSETVVDLQTMKLYIQKNLGIQVTKADIKMAHVLMMLEADKSHRLEESKTVEVQEYEIEEEQETAEKAIEELKTATEPQTVEDSTAVKEQEPKIEKDQKITEVLKTVVEPQMVNVLKTVEKQIIGEEEKTVGGQKTVPEPQMMEVSMTVEEQEQKIGEEQEMEEVSETVVDLQTMKLYIQKKLGIQVTKADIKMAHVLMMLEADKSHILDESETLEVQEYEIEEEKETAEKAIEELKTATEPQTVEDSKAVKEQVPKIEKDQKITEVLKTVVEPQMVNVLKTVEKQIIGEEEKTVGGQKTVPVPQMMEVSTTVEEQEQKIGEEQEMEEVSETVVDLQTMKLYIQKNLGIQVTKADIKMAHVLMMLEADKSHILDESETLEVQEYEIEEEKEIAEKAIEELKTATEPQTVEDSKAVKEQVPKIEKDQKITEVLKTVVEPQMVNVLKTVEKQIIGEEEKTVGGQKTVPEPQMMEESTTVEEQEQKIGEEQEMEEVSETVVDLQSMKLYIQKNLGIQVTKADIKMAHVLMMLEADKSHILDESETLEVQEYEIEEEKEIAEKAIEELKTATEPQTVEDSKAVKEQVPKIEKDQKITEVLKTVVEPQMVNVLKTVEKQIIGEEEKTVGGQKTVPEPQMMEESTTVEEQEQKIGEEQEMEEVSETVVDLQSMKLYIQKNLGIQVTKADIKMAHVLMMLEADESHILDESETLEVQEHKIEEEQETAEKSMQKLKTTTESQEQKIIEKQGEVDSIEVLELLESAAGPQILEEQKMEEKQAIKEDQRMEGKQNMAVELKIEEERTKEDTEMEEILKLVSELDISGEKDKEGRELPKERILALAKEADSVITRCSRTEKTIAAMRQEAEREKELAEQNEMQIEREMTTALKEEESDREKEKVREAEIARQKEIEIEKEITMALKEEEEEVEKRKVREKELEEQKKASRPAELAEHDNSQNPKGDPEELGSSGF